MRRHKYFLIVKTILLWNKFKTKKKKNMWEEQLVNPLSHNLTCVIVSQSFVKNKPVRPEALYYYIIHRISKKLQLTVDVYYKTFVCSECQFFALVTKVKKWHWRQIKIFYKKPDQTIAMIKLLCVLKVTTSLKASFWGLFRTKFQN